VEEVRCRSVRCRHTLRSHSAVTLCCHTLLSHRAVMHRYHTLLSLRVSLHRRFCVLLDTGDLFDFNAPNLEAVGNHLAVASSRSLAVLTPSDAPSSCSGVSIVSSDVNAPRSTLMACERDDVAAWREVWLPALKTCTLVDDAVWDVRRKVAWSDARRVHACVRLQLIPLQLLALQ
jgi:hypothetical protein